MKGHMEFWGDDELLSIAMVVMVVRLYVLVRL